MLILQQVQPVAPAITPPRQPPVAETPAAIEHAAAGDRARNDYTHDRGSDAGEHTRAARDLDPAQPVGPPPAFEANVLEADRARRAEPSGAGDGTESGAPAEAAPPAPPGQPAAPLPAVYVEGVAPATAPRIDLTR